MNYAEIIERIASVVGPVPRDMLSSPIMPDDMDNVTLAVMKEPLGYSWIARFEEILQDYTGAKHAIAVTNGTAALHLALVAAGVRRGDLVVVPTLTFAGCAAAVTYCGAEPYFVDCRYKPFGSINAYKLRRSIEEMTPHDRGRLRAIIVVDLLGHPSIDTDLLALDPEYKLTIIEDAAAAFGSRNLLACGNAGDIATISFNNNKIVTTGGGGAVLTSEAEYAVTVRHLATTAKCKSPWFFDHNCIGYNYRISNLCAALGLAQVQRLEQTVEVKRARHTAYATALDGVTGIELVKEAPGHRWNGWLNAVMMCPEFAGDEGKMRDELLAALTAAGYGCRAMFTPLHWLEPYKEYPRQKNLSVAEDIFKRTVCLPS